MIITIRAIVIIRTSIILIINYDSNDSSFFHSAENKFRF